MTSTKFHFWTRAVIFFNLIYRLSLLSLTNLARSHFQITYCTLLRETKLHEKDSLIESKKFAVKGFVYIHFCITYFLKAICLFRKRAEILLLMQVLVFRKLALEELFSSKQQIGLMKCLKTEFSRLFENHNAL